MATDRRPTRVPTNRPNRKNGTSTMPSPRRAPGGGVRGPTHRVLEHGVGSPRHRPPHGPRRSPVRRRNRRWPGATWRESSNPSASRNEAAVTRWSASKAAVNARTARPDSLISLLIGHQHSERQQEAVGDARQQCGVGIDGTGHQVKPPWDEGVADPRRPPSAPDRTTAELQSSGLTAAPSSSTRARQRPRPARRRSRCGSSSPADDTRAAPGRPGGRGPSHGVSSPGRSASSSTTAPTSSQSGALFDLERLEQGLRGAGERGRRVLPGAIDVRHVRSLRDCSSPEHGGIDSTVCCSAAASRSSARRSVARQTCSRSSPSAASPAAERCAASSACSPASVTSSAATARPRRRALVCHGLEGG